MSETTFTIPESIAGDISFCLRNAIDNAKELLRIHNESTTKSTRISRKIAQMYEDDILQLQALEKYTIEHGWAPF